MTVHQSAEDYLETIYVLAQRNGTVRSIDIANELGFSKPSVSVAMKKLREEKLISVDDKGYISLTSNGEKIALTTYQRHTFLTKWLVSLGVDEKTAEQDACRIEHVVSEESFLKIKSFVEHAGGLK